MRGANPLVRMRLVSLVLNVYKAIKPKETLFAVSKALNDLIFNEMIALCEAKQTEFMLLYLPWGPELKDAALESGGERYFEKYVAATGIQSLNPRPLFLATDTTEVRYNKGHYKKPAATVVARAVYEKITTFPAYKNVARQRPSQSP